MSLRFTLYSIDHSRLLQCFGSKDEALYARAQEHIEASGPSADDELEVLRSAIFDGLPARKLDCESAAHKAVMFHLAMEADAEPVFDEGYKVPGLWSLAENYPWLARPTTGLAWLLSGRPLFADRFLQFGWNYYAHLTGAELVPVRAMLAELQSIIPSPRVVKLPPAPADLVRRSAEVQNDTDAGALFRQCLHHADGTSLVYTAMEAMRAATGRFPTRAAKTLHDLRYRDDPHEWTRELTSELVRALGSMTDEQPDLWFYAE